MAKNFIKPVILKSSWGGDGSEIGGGSAGSSTDISAVDFYEWIEMYGEDFDNDGDIDWDDYRTWWIDNELDPDIWDFLNPDHPWEP